MMACRGTSHGDDELGILTHSIEMFSLRYEIGGAYPNDGLSGDKPWR
jgi:hypothetical protein